MIKDNIKGIIDEIPEDVQLVAVSKKRNEQEIREVLAAGIIDLGENKVQEFLKKLVLLEGENINWHFIGHLQRNKVKYLIGKVFLIHSVDSIRLAKEINQQSLKKNIITDILVQVNTSGEESKYGFAVDEIDYAVEEILKYDHVRVCGLMTMAPKGEKKEEVAKIFGQTREIYDRINKDICNNSLQYLSMGMSDDYLEAIIAGATMVRVGSKIFKRDG
jgi:pyridoxal phosphate enzyme (YggS family)